MIPISQDAATLVANWQIPANLEFGREIAPIMASCQYKSGQWSAPELGATATISLHPAAKCFHYGQCIFEGLKAFGREDGAVGIFRPEKNAERLNHSAERLCMPMLPPEIFLNAVSSLVYHLKQQVSAARGSAMYIRPFMFATEPGLKLSVANEYLFMVLASPVASYFSSAKVTAVVSRDQSRAAPGGTGYAKAAGNYAASLQAQTRAYQAGYSQILWLDAVERRYIEEFSGMNFFAVINGEIVTPSLSGSILSGITRESLIAIARKRGLAIREDRLAIDTLLEAIKAGNCSEVFACGTAAVVSSIDTIIDANQEAYDLPVERPLAQRLKKELLDIQHGESDLFPEWLHKV